MTDWKSSPEEVVTLPEDGKVTGQFTVVWQDDKAFIHTDAHINDDKPAVNFRGESFLVSLHVHLNSSGGVIGSSNVHVTRRSNWSPAPRTFAVAIEAAVTEAVEKAWTPEKARAGLEAVVAQNLHHLEREQAEAQAKVDEAAAKIEAEKARLGVKA